MPDRALAGQMPWNEDNLCRRAVCNGAQLARRRDMRRTERLSEHHTPHPRLLDVLPGNLRLILLVLCGRCGNRHGKLGG